MRFVETEYFSYQFYVFVQFDFSSADISHMSHLDLS